MSYIVTDSQNKANKILFNSPKFLEKRIAFSAKDSSPTGSYESNRRWAGKQYNRLIKLNDFLNLPSFALTLKLTQYYDGEEITKHLHRFNINLQRKLKKLDSNLYAIAYKEIEPNNLVHLHLLVWSNLELDQIKTIVSKAIPKSFACSLPYIEPIDCVNAYSSYITGYCKSKHNRLLFKANAMKRYFKYLGSLTQSLAKQIFATAKVFTKKKEACLDHKKIRDAIRIIERVKNIDLGVTFINCRWNIKQRNIAINKAYFRKRKVVPNICKDLDTS